MSDFIFKIQPNIVLGSYTASRLAQNALEYGSKFMLIIDPILKESGTSDKIIQSLDNRSIDYFEFNEIPSPADSEVLNSALQLARNARIHGIIAAGGNKTLSIAKALCAVYNDTHDLYDFIDGAVPSTAPIPLICLPTTLRNNFLFTDTTPITDARSKKIKFMKTQNGVCRLVLWDPSLSASLTEKQVSTMTVETLCTAIEAYISQKATFFSDMLIEKALQLINYGIEGTDTLTVTTPQEVLLTQAGCMTSLGAASSSLGAASLISYGVKSRYNISTSLTSAVLLPYIIEDAAKFQLTKLAKIAKILKVCAEDTPENDAVTALTEYIRQYIAKINIPSRLKELSLSIEQLTLAIEDCGETELINSLPRSMTADDLFELIKQAY